jgi:hypothetical protein
MENWNVWQASKKRQKFIEKRDLRRARRPDTASIGCEYPCLVGFTAFGLTIWMS